MKIITKNVVIECDYKDFEKAYIFIMGLTKPTIEIRKKGSGKYKHKSKVSDEKKEIIKKIFENYPNRSSRSVAKELNLTEDQVRYWRKHEQT